MSDPVRFLLDENVELAVAIGLRREGVDALSVVEIGRAGLDDRLQMAFALSAQRVIVTYDDDYLALSASGAAHCGIAFCAATRLSIGQMIRALKVVHDESTPSQLAGQIRFL